jgi:type III restriction enzyme
VVSVAMLTEGWDAQTVTHILGVRAFGTQLLCEQAVGRALRRQSYDINSDGFFDVEYADILGIPFDFASTPVTDAKPQPPKMVFQVQAVPDRAHLTIVFPRVQGYHIELEQDTLKAEFNDNHIMELTAERVGPTITKNAGIIGESVDLNLKHLKDTRKSTILYHLVKFLLENHWKDDDGQPRLHLFNQLKIITQRWLNECLFCRDDTYPALLIYKALASDAAKRINDGITLAMSGERPVKAILDPFNPTGSTEHVNFSTTKHVWATDANLSHVNYAVLDSAWEGEFCRVVEGHPKVRSYVKNQGLGLEVPYRIGSTARRYFPDFIVRVDDGHGPHDLLNLVVEIKGYKRLDAKEKKLAMEEKWLPGVNNAKVYGRWAFAEFFEVTGLTEQFSETVKKFEANGVETASGIFSLRQ